MFILRRVTSDNCESNEMLGKEYSVIYKESNEEHFEKMLEIQNQVDNRELLYGFIVCHFGQDVMPLFNKSRYYIMTESGQTFANISFR